MLAIHPSAITGTRTRSKKTLGFLLSLLFTADHIQIKRNRVTRQVPQAMITWSISSDTGARSISPRRLPRRASFSSTVSRDASPITWRKVKGYLTAQPIFSQKPAKMEVTGTPVKSQVRYHSPATAPAGNTSSSHPLLSPRVRRPVRIRHNSATPPRAVENTNAVGL